MKKNFYNLWFVLSILLFTKFVSAQCSVSISDSLYNDFNLHLYATPTSGVPPFTYVWTITGSTTNNPITPSYTSTNGDTIIVSANDLFANYGCIIINLCLTDSIGCTNCMGDTAYTNAIACYSGFNWQETQPGQMQIMLSSPVPEFIGMSVMTWTQSGSGQAGAIVGGLGMFTYIPPEYNPNGYDVPVCVQTFFSNTSFMCIACDTVHFSASTPLNNKTEILENIYSIPSKITTGSLQISWHESNMAVCTLLDLNGRVVLNTKIENGVQYIGMQSLAAGVYLLKLRHAQNEFTEKIVKQ